MGQRLFGYLTILSLSVCARRLTRQPVWERYVENYSNPSYNVIELNMTKPDRKMFSVNISVEIVQDLPPNAMLKATLYKYTDNVFKKTAFAYEGTVCEYFDVVQKAIIEMDENLSKNFFKHCPITKGMYTIYNLNEKLMRNPLLPLWRCKLEFGFSLPNKDLFKGTLYFTVIEKLTRQVALKRYDENYVNTNYIITEVNISKPSRTMFSVNATFIIVQDFPLDLKFRAYVYKYADNAYKKTALEYQGTLCEYYKNVEKILFNVEHEVYKHFIRGCPVKKGRYYGYDFNEKLGQSPFLPLWTCKLDFAVYSDTEVVYDASVYFTIVEV